LHKRIVRGQISAAVATVPVVHAAKADGWHGYVKPAAIYFGQGGAPFLAQLHWSSWNGTSAWATAKLQRQSLVPRIQLRA
jgi:hypothetical protein